MRGTINLILDTAYESPFLFRSKLSNNLKYKIFLTYLKISFKLFTIHRVKKQTKENILGFNVETFDYGALHFLFREIFLKNTYFFKIKKKKVSIFDCGSNIGLSVIYFKVLYPDSVIHAFEPDPKTFKLLRQNIYSNNIKNVFLHNVALQRRSGFVDFYIDKKNPGWLTMSTIQERLPGKDRIIVKSLPLSDFIKTEVDFLKMDIEGAEGKVIEELIKSRMLKKVGKIAVEFHLFRNNPLPFLGFLKNMIKEGFTFSLSTGESNNDVTFQDVMVYLRRE